MNIRRSGIDIDSNCVILNLKKCFFDDFVKFFLKKNSILDYQDQIILLFSQKSFYCFSILKFFIKILFLVIIMKIKKHLLFDFYINNYSQH